MVSFFLKKYVKYLQIGKIYDKIFDVIHRSNKGGAKMPNKKKKKKRVKIIEKKTLRNNMIKSAYKTSVKNFEAAIEAGKLEEAKVLFAEATKKIDQACSKGVIVKNTAARKKSNLAKKLNAAIVA